MRRLAGLLVAVGLLAQAAWGQDAARRETVVVGEQFRRGGLHRLLFGANYRDLWTTPVELPVLDLRGFAGGLVPTRRVGHGQTQALALKGQDGRAYTFRPIVKDPIGLVPVELRDTLALGFVRDQMSSQHPAAHVVVPVLAQALGLLHNTPELVILPDDPALGEFRADFGNSVGDIEEFVGQKGFGGGLESLREDAMWKALDAGPEVRVDARAYLKARLLDHLIGDWDRHRGQWTFVRLPDTPLWQPIPEDRDQAFVRFQGLAISQLRGGLPLLVNFGTKHSRLAGLTYDSWDVDRRLLTELEAHAWDEVAAEARAKLTDAVLAEAARRLPAAWFDRQGAELLAALRSRRDALPEHARRFYRYLAEEVDVRGTDQAERAEITRQAGGDVEIALYSRAAGASAEPWFRRRFRRDETREVRLILLGGDDEVVARGPRGGVRVRAVGGAGNDRYDDAAAGGLQVFDAEGASDVAAGPGTRVDQAPYKTPPPNPRADWMPARDWGRHTILPVTRLTYESDIGALLNVGFSTTGYGFRKHPYADKQSLRLSFSSARRDGRIEYQGDFRRASAPLRFGLVARASELELLYFYGFGNATRDLGRTDEEFHRVEQTQVLLQPELRLSLGARARLGFGPMASYSSSETGKRFIDALRPYGSGAFAQAGAQAGLEVDTRDKPGLPARGLLASLGGAYYPAVLDVEKPFGELHGEARTWLGARSGRGPALVLGAGGKRVFGRYPFHEAAHLGGGDSVRGLRKQRYAGDAALWASAELRVGLAKAFLLVPGQVGLFGLVDTGRVWLEGEDSDRWHTGAGGGVFFASPNGRSAVSLAVARSEGRLGIYLRTGLGF